MIAPLTCGWVMHSTWGMECRRWICKKHEQSMEGNLQCHVCRSWMIWVMQKVHNFDLLSKASDDATFSFCPFCCKVTMLCLYNVTHLHTWIRFGIHMFLLLELSLEPTSFVARICKANICLFIEEEGAMLQSPRSGWSHPYHIKKFSHIVLPNNL